jgi:predicted nucleotidyltransferase
MKQNKQQILKRLQKHLNFSEQYFNKDRILGIFLYGSQNYGLDTEKSDVDSILILLPSFEDLLFNKTWYSKELYFENEHIVVKDIRCYREELLKQNLNYLETLLGDYYILNNKYEELFKLHFFNNKNLIGNYNNIKMKKAVAGQLYNILKQAKTANTLKKENKKLANCFRLRMTIEKIGCITNLEDILKLSDFNLKKAMDLKLGKISKEEKEKEYLLCEYAASEVFSTKDSDAYINKAALDVVNEGVSAIMRLSFMKKEDEYLTKEEFFKQLTHAEERAFHSIVNTIGNEGNITISKLVEENSISRPVYNNLIKKLKEYHIADILNMGMKGTYIKIINPLLKDSFN